MESKGESFWSFWSGTLFCHFLPNFSSSTHFWDLFCCSFMFQMFPEGDKSGPPTGQFSTCTYRWSLAVTEWFCIVLLELARLPLNKASSGLQHMLLSNPLYCIFFNINDACPDVWCLCMVRFGLGFVVTVENCVYRLWFLDVTLSPCCDFHCYVCIFIAVTSVEQTKTISFRGILYRDFYRFSDFSISTVDDEIPKFCENICWGPFLDFRTWCLME